MNLSVAPLSADNYNRTFTLAKAANDLFHAAIGTRKKPIRIAGTTRYIKPVFDEKQQCIARCKNRELGRLYALNLDNEKITLDEHSQLRLNSNPNNTVFKYSDELQRPLFNFLDGVIKAKANSLEEIFAKSLQNFIHAVKKLLAKNPKAKGQIAHTAFYYHSGTHGTLQVVMRIFKEKGKLRLELNANDIHSQRPFKHPNESIELAEDDIRQISSIDLDRISWEKSPWEMQAGEQRKSNWAELEDIPTFKQIITLYNDVIKGKKPTFQ